VIACACVRACVRAQTDAKAMGERARRRVQTHFSSTAVRDVVVARLTELDARTQSRDGARAGKQGFFKRLFGIGGGEKKRDPL
jgi:hypothetical protein